MEIMFSPLWTEVYVFTPVDGGLCFHPCRRRFMFSTLWTEVYVFTPVDGGYVFTPVCLFVCLWTGYLKRLWTDWDEIWWRGCVCDNDKMIRFWWKSEFGSNNYLSDSSPLCDRAKNNKQHDISKTYGWIWTKRLGWVC